MVTIVDDSGDHSMENYCYAYRRTPTRARADLIVLVLRARVDYYDNADYH